MSTNNNNLNNGSQGNDSQTEIVVETTMMSIQRQR